MNTWFIYRGDLQHEPVLDLIPVSNVEHTSEIINEGLNGVSCCVQEATEAQGPEAC